MTVGSENINNDGIHSFTQNHSYTNLPPTHRTPINSHSTLDKAVPVQDFNENIEMVDVCSLLCILSLLL